MARERDGEIRFECLRCGKASKVEKIQTLRPQCGNCGSKTGVLGDIGQGTLTSRLRRDFNLGSDYAGDVPFECLSCGETTTVEKVTVLQPRCPHCGAVSGLLVENNGLPGEVGMLVAAALLSLIGAGPF